jgi:hypothetical protein
LIPDLLSHGAKCGQSNVSTGDGELVFELVVRRFAPGAVILAFTPCHNFTKLYGSDFAANVKMADPLAFGTAAVQSTKSLCDTIKRYKGRDKTLGRVQNEVEDIVNILDSLTQLTSADPSKLKLLKGPIERCSLVCSEFEQAMERFGGKSKAGFRDWAKLEFMRGDINEFIDTISGYKATFSVGLCTIAMLVASLVSFELR